MTLATKASATLGKVAHRAGDIGRSALAFLARNDSLGISVIFALQASLVSLAARWLAMYPQLDAPCWAASTVIIAAQASRSPGLPNAVNRLLGTAIGVCAGLVIVALFPQGWWSFSLAIAAWLAPCTFFSCLFRALQSYAAALGRVRRTLHRDFVGASYAALRTFVGITAAFALRVESRWPTGAASVLIAGILLTLFAARPSPIAVGPTFTIGAIGTMISALFLDVVVLLRLGGFAGLALFPFLFAGAFCIKSRTVAP